MNKIGEGAMLVRKDKEIEIWTDTREKGMAKKCFILAIISIITLSLCVLLIDSDVNYTNKEFLYVTLLFVGIPSSLFIIAGLVNLSMERKKPEMILKINSDYIEMNRKKATKRIELKLISEVDIIYSKYGSFIDIFYKENENKKKYSFPISPANRGLAKIAIEEYLKGLVFDKQ